MSWARFKRLSSKKDLTRYRRATTFDGGGGGGGNDPDAQAYIDALDAAGYTVSGAEETAINTFVLDLKADGIWTKSKAIYPFIGGTAATHKFNLKDPRDLDAAFRLTFFGGWVHSATGSKPNGVNGYANTHYNASLEMTLHDGSLSFYSRTQNIINSEQAFIANEGNIRLIQCCPILNLGLGFVGTIGGIGTSSVAANSDARGFYVSSRTSSTSLKGYKNASILGTNTSAGPHTLPNADLLIGASNASINWSILECALASVGDGLTDGEVTNYYTAVQALQTALNREV